MPCKQPQTGRAWVGIVAALAMSPTVRASDARARSDYMIHCMGCHGETGTGFKSQVPSMRGTLARIATLRDGRAYLLRVPGVTQSGLDPERTAEVLNWALREFSDPELAGRIQPFTASEVVAGRSQPLLEITSTREDILRHGGLAEGSPGD